MKHLAKLWLRRQAMVSASHWKWPSEICMNDHFRERYFEIQNATQLPCFKLQSMNYLNMAMVWTEIVMHKDADWRTIYGKNVNVLNQIQRIIPTNWDRPSDCWPRWLNRRLDDIGYGAPTFTRPYKGPSRGYDPPSTSAMACEGQSHGYDYNPHNTACNVPPPTFVVAQEQPNLRYDYNPYHSVTNVLLPTFDLQATTCDRDEEEF
jgi:hypothetical protein